MSLEEKVVVITDIDGTLGVTDQEIQETLTGFRSLLSKCVFCLITGRSLKGLARLQVVVPHNSYIAPWGGGNIFFYDGYCTPVRPIRRISATFNLDSFTCVMLPEKNQYTETDECHVLWADRVFTDGCPVSAYQQMLKTQKRSIETTQQHNTYITTGRGFLWLHVSPFLLPRLETVKWFKQKYPEKKIVYLGDSPVDGDCLDAVDFFLTHRESPLSGINNTIVYNDFSDLPSKVSSFIRAV